MGQNTSASGSKKNKEIESIAQKCYETYFKDKKDCSEAMFYGAVCETVEEINKKFGSTQLTVPKTTTLKLVYERYKDAAAGGKVSEGEFQDILQEVLLETGFTGLGAKDILLYLFGIPVTGLMIKKKSGLKVHDDIFIPAITSATVFLLAKLNKI